MIFSEQDLSLCPMEAIFVKREKIVEMNKFILFPIKEGKFVCFVMLRSPEPPCCWSYWEAFHELGALRWFHNV